MPDSEVTGDSIPKVFETECIDARFVVAMSMARNDIEVAVREGIAAAAADRPDFGYRVRLATAHLVEALDSLNAYSQDDDVKKLMARVPAEARRQLSQARSVLQKVGSKVLDQVRNNTFHVPSPKTSYSPTSDEQIRDVLANMSDRHSEPHPDHHGEHPIVTLDFAGDVALALAIARHSADIEVARQQFEIAAAGPSPSSTGLTRLSSPSSRQPVATSEPRGWSKISRPRKEKTIASGWRTKLPRPWCRFTSSQTW